MFTKEQLEAAYKEFFASPLEVEVLGGGPLNGPVTIYRRPL
jgi:hypothetical protein